MAPSRLGLGIGWRPPIALDIERRHDLGFVEITAENINLNCIPQPLLDLHRRGIQIIPHGISLSLGGTEPIDPKRVRHLAELARRFDSPLVSEHIAFVRAGGIEAGHLLPLPCTHAAIDVVVENVRIAQELLPVPLALENIAALFEWPQREMDDAEFVGQIIERTGARLLLDLANIWANARNTGSDAIALLKQMPLDRLAYVHIAGGEERDGTYHDTHAADVSPQVLELLEQLCIMADPNGVMLERDDQFPAEANLNKELDAVADAIALGRARAI
jgi:uncharacterized protein (UPF0276 family)